MAGSRAIEARAGAGLPAHALMARAGWAVARLALALAPHGRQVTVLAGPGNNGGDGLLAAVHLHRMGRSVRVVLLADPQRLPADAADAWAQARDAGVPVTDSLDPLGQADLIVDALLGLGLRRAPAGTLAVAIDAIRRAGRPVLSVDLPSGLDADTGQPLGDACVRADWTLSLLTLKPGLFTARGRDLAGDVWFDPLDADSPDDTAAPAPVAWIGASQQAPEPGLIPRTHVQHKGSFGDLTVVGGSPGMEGAALLAADAALTAGAGRVYLSGLSPRPPDRWPPDLMQSPVTWADDAAAMRRGTVVCGCGGGRLVAQRLPALLREAGRLVLDADALNAVAADGRLRAQLAARATQGLHTVLTPHPLEAARLLGGTTADVQGNRLAAARELAERHRAVVVLKGSGSVVAAPGQPTWINASGNAALAAPGSGDVLAGWLGGLWAQQADDTLTSALFAARAAVWLHGHAADRLLQQQPGLSALPLRACQLAAAMAAALG